MREHVCVHTHNVLSYMFTKIILQKAVYLYTHEHQNWHSLQTCCSMVLQYIVGYRFMESLFRLISIAITLKTADFR